MPSVSRVKWAKFRVTAVSVVAIAILFTLFYLLTGGTLLQPKAMIYLYVPDATGLDATSPVRVDGIDVGKVSKVELTRQSDPNRVVRVSMVVERERLSTITYDSYAEIGSDSLIGDKYVDITSQTSARPIPPFGEIRVKPPSDVMKDMDLPQLESQLRTIDALITDIEAGRGQVGQFVLGTQIYTDVSNSVGKIEKAFNAAVKSSNAVDAIYHQQLYNSIVGPMQKMDDSLARLQSGQGAGGALLRDTAQYDSALKSIQDLITALANVRSGVWIQSDDAYQGWNQMLVSWIQQVDKATADPLLNSTAVYENLLGSTAEARDTIKDFRENPRKYLRLKLF
ncbi:MAG TPA: MlaD family protein [Candidatus Sulfopaludibacter sp.]|jgi:phospholipid/cholesterol/gamma-HCH transport system substrate-binding protein|nr:MlaD family protein [Candidatus Sulfopaludibacter sp.]